MRAGARCWAFSNKLCGQRLPRSMGSIPSWRPGAGIGLLRARSRATVEITPPPPDAGGTFNPQPEPAGDPVCTAARSGRPGECLRRAAAVSSARPRPVSTGSWAEPALVLGSPPKPPSCACSHQTLSRVLCPRRALVLRWECESFGESVRMKPARASSGASHSHPQPRSPPCLRPGCLRNQKSAALVWTLSVTTPCALMPPGLTRKAWGALKTADHFPESPSCLRNRGGHGKVLPPC